MNLKILLADDVDELAKSVGRILVNNNYQVDIVNNGKEACDKVKECIYDCIILDIMMPVMDGIEAVKCMRKMNLKTPIILLTAKDYINDKVEGLDSGANDYLTKPFEVKELLARIRALTRDKIEKYEIGNIYYNKEKAEISKDNISLKLTPKECELIEYFIKNPERKISESELKQRIWTSGNINDSIVPLYIDYLQEKFMALNANVEIESRDGYHLTMS